MWRNYIGSEVIDVRGKLPTHEVKKYQMFNKQQFNYITIHHSGTKSGSPKDFAEYHVKKLDWPGIGYHFVLDQKGNIYFCHDLTTIAYHTKGRNTGNIGICIIGMNGNFSLSQLDRLEKLTVALCQSLKMRATDVLGHREHPYQRTACPSIQMEAFRHSINNKIKDLALPHLYPTLRTGMRGEYVKIMQEALIKKGYLLKHFGADGIFGTETEKMIRKFQKDNQLEEDGITGRKTWKSLYE